MTNNNSPKYYKLPIHLYSSVERFIHSSDLFPTHDRRIGIQIRAGYHPEHKQVMVEIDEERPSFVSTNRGEYLEIGEVIESDEKIREILLQLSTYCIEVSRELEEHSRRLKELATSTSPILDTNKLKMIESEEEKGERESNGRGRLLSPSLDYMDPGERAYKESHTHTHSRARSTNSARKETEKKSSLNLALLME